MTCDHVFVYTGEKEKCTTCKGSVFLKIHKCSKCGLRVTGNPKDLKEKSHAKAARNEKRQKEMAHKSMLARRQYDPKPFEWLYPGIKDPIPDQDAILRDDEDYVPVQDHTWSTRHKVCRQYVAAMKSLAETDHSSKRIVRAEKHPKGDEGIIYVGGDTPRSYHGFMAAVSIMTLIKSGYKGRIQWWFDPPHQSNPIHYLYPFNLQDRVEVRSFHELPIQHRVKQGWWLKILASLYTDLEKFILIDADAHFTRSPELLLEFIRNNSFAFWAKLQNPAYEWAKNWLGGTYGHSPLNGGHLLINKQKCWNMLVGAMFVCQHMQYFDPNLAHIQHVDSIYGDEDAYFLSMISLEKWGTPLKATKLGNVRAKGHDIGHLVLECEFGGVPYIAHRIFPKLSPHEFFNRDPNKFAGELQLFDSWNKVSLLAPPHWTFRMDPILCDTYHYKTVVCANEYKLPKLNAEDLVIDIGGNVGSFVQASFIRGSRNIHTVEPHPENYKLLESNLAHCTGVTKYNAAIWGGETSKTKLTVMGPDKNSGAFELTETGDGPEVSVYSFDPFVLSLLPDGGRIRFLKLDCEGAEDSILKTSQILDRVDEIGAEIHGRTKENWDKLIPIYKERLLAAGFTSIETDLKSPEFGQGLLFAKRKIENETTKDEGHTS